MINRIINACIISLEVIEKITQCVIIHTEKCIAKTMDFELLITYIVNLNIILFTLFVKII